MGYLETKSQMGSSMEGYWERQICSTRNILNLLLITHGESLDNESLRALLLEVERISILDQEHVN